MWVCDRQTTTVLFPTLDKAKHRSCCFCCALSFTAVQTVTLFPDEMLLPLFASYHKWDIDGWLRVAVLLFMAEGQGNSYFRQMFIF